MAKLTAIKIKLLQARGLSQDAIGAMYSLTQSRVSQILKQGGLSAPRTRVYVNRAQRDGTVAVGRRVIWEPYHIPHPGVAKMFF